MNKILLSALLSWSLVCAALDEKTADFATRLTDYFRTGVDGQLQGQSFAGQPIHIAYHYFLKPKALGSIVISAGYTESLQKYSELALDLNQAGYSVFLFDHRGQGFSDHLLSDSRRGFIDDFSNFATDLKTYVQDVVKPHSTANLYLLAHSLGGAVAVDYLERFPDDFSRVVLAAPMLKLKLHGLPEFLVSGFLSVLHVCGLDELYVEAPRDPALATFADNQVTHSETRFQALAIGIDRQWPKIQIWAPTAGWLRQSLIGTRKIAQNASKIRTPVLLFQADQDAYVGPSAQKTFCASIPVCSLHIFSNSRHEILMESDGIRNAAIAQIVDFLR